MPALSEAVEVAEQPPTEPDKDAVTPLPSEERSASASLRKPAAYQGESLEKSQSSEASPTNRTLENLMPSPLEKVPVNFDRDANQAVPGEDPPVPGPGSTFSVPQSNNSATVPKTPVAGASQPRGGPQRRRFHAEGGAKAPPQPAASQSTANGAVSSEAKPPMSWTDWAAAMYSWTWKPLIRPPREIYNIADLGRTQFVFRGRAFTRTDVSIQNGKGQRLSCSHFRQVKHNQVIPQHCVVYLHGSSSSRLEAFDVLPVLLPAGLSVFCLDLSGSGQSEGEFISLGFHEEQDLRAVLAHLRADANVKSVGIWGRSMGATAAVMRAAEDRLLAACILDSPFTDLRMAIVEYIQNSQVRLPSFAIDGVIQLARSEVKSRAGFDINDVASIKYAERATCPALFAVAADDSFVLPHHTQELHNKWGGDRQLRFFEGGHNGRRPKWFLDEAAVYLCQKLEGWKPPDEVVLDPEQQERDAEEARRRTYWL